MREKVSSPKNIFQKSVGLEKLAVKFGGAFEASHFKFIVKLAKLHKSF